VTRLTAIQGDITTIQADVIVNAANSSLMGGGGVDGAIHSAGGPAILEDCRVIVARAGRLPTGEAVVTTAGRLHARHVVHTVGPIWGSVMDDEAVLLLASCYSNSLTRARDVGASTIAFPNISTGVYRFPKQLAAETAVRAVKEWMVDNPGAITEVVFVSFDPESQQIYEHELQADV
jgi:O-acetyl-ADP-ribose deacetylase (regulator of RNase III)